MRSIKCVVVGDGTVGKTSMLMSYSMNSFSNEYIPTIFDNYSITNMFNGEQPVCLNLWDTPGQDDYDNIRSVCYSNVDVFIIAFSIICPKSFENIRIKWYPDIIQYSPTTPVILVGTKTDLRNNKKIIEELKILNQEPISYPQGYSLGMEISAYKYLECSPLTKEGLNAIFEEAQNAVLLPKKSKKNKKCNIL